MAGGFRLDAAYLKSVGLNVLPAEEANVVLSHVYETLELRVGIALARRMTNAQLNEFERLIDAADEEGALKWLEAEFPDYRDVVGDQLEIVTAELADVAPLMLALVGSGE